MAAKNVTFTSVNDSNKPSAAFTLTVTYPHAEVVEFVEEVVQQLFDSPEEYLPFRLMSGQWTSADLSPDLLALLPSRKELIKRVSVGDLRPLLERVVNENKENLDTDFFCMVEDSTSNLAMAIMEKFISTKAAINAIIKKAEAREEAAMTADKADSEAHLVRFLRSKGYKVTKK